MDEYRKGRSIFWPVLLIGLGTIWLLSNFGIIPNVNWYMLLNLWPLLLVALGLQILFGRRARWMGSVLAALIVLGVLGLMVFAPQLGWPTVGEMKTESYKAPKKDTESAVIRLDLDFGNSHVYPKESASNLLEAQVTHNGQVNFSAVGDTRQTVSLDLDRGFSFFDIGAFADDDVVQSEIGIAPDVTLDLKVDHGSGKGIYELDELTLSALNFDLSSGDISLSLPNGSYDAEFDISSGEIRATVREEANLDMKIEVSSGELNMTFSENTNAEIQIDLSSGSIDLVMPEGVGVKLFGNVSSGSVSVPKGYQKISGGDRDRGGTWESPGYAEAEYKIVIEFDVSSGRITIR
jgi:hypothetical protein